MERFLTLPRPLKCNYCSDDSTLPYVKASAWENTIGLDNAGDALQVRCPGCDSLHPGEPAFYHGIGYGPATGLNAFASITAGTDDLGGPVISGSGAGARYVFSGSTASHLGNPSEWTKSAAATAGMPPASAGHVNSTFMSAVKTHALGLPCCVTSPSGGRKSNTGGTGNSGSDNYGNTQTANRFDPLPGAAVGSQGLTVFPVPATQTLNFQYSLQDNVTIKLMDITGRLMEEQVLQNSSFASFNVASYVPGVYLYQVITDGTTQSGKVLIGK